MSAEEAKEIYGHAIPSAVNTDEMAGICLRGKPGWGDLFAPLTTVVQTFGGNWYNEQWDATVNTPEWKEGGCGRRKGAHWCVCHQLLNVHRTAYLRSAARLSTHGSPR